MAERDVINVALQLANPDVLKRLENIRAAGQTVNWTINIKSNIDRGLERILSGNEKTITITADTTRIQADLLKLEKTFRQLQAAATVQVKIGSTPDIQQRNYQRAFLQERGFNTVGISNLQLSQSFSQEDFKFFKEELDRNFRSDVFRRESSRAVQQARALNEAIKRSNQNPGIARSEGPRAAAEKFGGGLSSADLKVLEQIATNQPLFDPSRLNTEESRTQLGFSFLFGGFPSLLGAAAGGVTGGSSGVFLGSALTQKAVGSAIEAFEHLKNSLLGVGEAGLEFERSLLNITSIFQVSTKLVGAGGQELPLGQELQIQGKRARDIQLEARKKLIPFGISGESEATIVSGLISGLSVRGVNPTGKAFTEFAERIGASIVTFAPQLLGNPTQLGRDIRGLAAGTPQAARETLGQQLRFIAPDLFTPGRIKNQEDLLRATDRLDEIVKTLTGDSDNAAISFLRLKGAFSNIQTITGDQLLKSIKPGLDALVKELNRPELQGGFINLAGSIGHLISFVLQKVAQLAKSITPNEIGKQLAQFGPAVGVGGGAALGGVAGGLLGLVAGNPILGALIGAAGGEGLGAVLSSVFSSDNFFKVMDKIGEQTAKDILSDSKNKPKVENRYPISDILRGVGLENEPSSLYSSTITNSPQARTEALKKVFDKYRDSPEFKADATGFDLLYIKTLNENLADTISRIDTTTFGGGLQAANFRRSTSLQNVSLAQTALKDATTDIEKEVASRALVEAQKDYNQSIKASEDQFIQLKESQISYRNSVEKLADVQKNEILQRKELIISIEQNKLAFNNLYGSFAIQNIGAINQRRSKAQEYIASGGNPADVATDDLYTQFNKEGKLKQLKAEYQQSSYETGESSRPAEDTSGLSANSPLRRQQELQIQALTISAERATNSLDIVSRPARDAAESLELLSIKLNQFLRDFQDINNQPKVPSGGPTPVKPTAPVEYPAVLPEPKKEDVKGNIDNLVPFKPNFGPKDFAKDNDEDNDEDKSSNTPSKTINGMGSQYQGLIPFIGNLNNGFQKGLKILQNKYDELKRNIRLPNGNTIFPQYDVPFGEPLTIAASKTEPGDLEGVYTPGPFGQYGQKLERNLSDEDIKKVFPLAGSSKANMKQTREDLRFGFMDWNEKLSGYNDRSKGIITQSPKEYPIDNIGRQLKAKALGIRIDQLAAWEMDATQPRAQTTDNTRGGGPVKPNKWGYIDGWNPETNSYESGGIGEKFSGDKTSEFGKFNQGSYRDFGDVNGNSSFQLKEGGKVTAFKDFGGDGGFTIDGKSFPEIKPVTTPKLPKSLIKLPGDLTPGEGLLQPKAENTSQLTPAQLAPAVNKDSDNSIFLKDIASKLDRQNLSDAFYNALKREFP